MDVLLVTVGKVVDEILYLITDEIEEIFKGIVTLKVSDTSLPIPEQSWNKNRGQYKSDIILEEIDKLGKDMGIILVGITSEDLFVPGLNFVFGQAKIHGNACIVSLHRLRPEFYRSNANRELLKIRLKKEVIHELGHVLGLPHCGDRSCVMSFSNSIKDVDYKRDEFCNICWRKFE